MQNEDYEILINIQKTKITEMEKEIMLLREKLTMYQS